MQKPLKLCAETLPCEDACHSILKTCLMENSWVQHCSFSILQLYSLKAVRTSSSVIFFFMDFLRLMLAAFALSAVLADPSVFLAPSSILTPPILAVTALAASPFCFWTTEGKLHTLLQLCFNTCSYWLLVSPHCHTLLSWYSSSLPVICILTECFYLCTIFKLKALQTTKPCTPNNHLLVLFLSWQCRCFCGILLTFLHCLPGILWPRSSTGGPRFIRLLAFINGWQVLNGISDDVLVLGFLLEGLLISLQGIDDSIRILSLLSTTEKSRQFI